jgi:hypothetical protein
MSADNAAGCCHRPGWSGAEMTNVLVLGANGQLAGNAIPFLLRNLDVVP